MIIRFDSLGNLEKIQFLKLHPYEAVFFKDYLALLVTVQ